LGGQILEKIYILLIKNNNYKRLLVPKIK